MQVLACYSTRFTIALTFHSQRIECGLICGMQALAITVANYARCYYKNALTVPNLLRPYSKFVWAACITVIFRHCRSGIFKVHSGGRMRVSHFEYGTAGMLC